MDVVGHIVIGILSSPHVHGDTQHAHDPGRHGDHQHQQNSFFWIIQNKQQDDGGHGSGGTQQRGCRTSVTGNVCCHRPDHGTQHQGQQIKSQEWFFPNALLDRAAEHPQPEHVKKQVVKIRVGKTVREKLPPLKRRLPAVRIDLELIGQPICVSALVDEKTVSKKQNDVEDDQIGRHAPRARGRKIAWLVIILGIITIVKTHAEILMA